MKNPEIASKYILYREIEEAILRIKKKKKRYVFFHKVIKILLLIAGGAITVLTGWKFAPTQSIDPNVILLLSSAITIVAAIESLFDTRDKAMGYTVLLFELRKLRDTLCFNYEMSKDQFDKEIANYQKAYEDILASQKTIIENSYQNGD